MLRINHAGEHGAVAILKGQIRKHTREQIRGRKTESQQQKSLEDMLAQEQRHLASFERILPDYSIRPSALLPLWRALGYWLGYASAHQGAHIANLCISAIETEIEAHYARQISRFSSQDWASPELLAMLRQFRDEERQHRETAEQTIRPETRPILHLLVREATQLAIRIAGKI